MKNVDYSKAVRVARSLADLSQSELARLSGVERSYLSMIESGSRQPSTKTLEKISKSLDIPFHIFTVLGLGQDSELSLNQRDMQSLAEHLVAILLRDRKELNAAISSDRSE
jgi:transcriptional regulator with XRE-family HTH domain